MTLSHRWILTIVLLPLATALIAFGCSGDDGDGAGNLSITPTTGPEGGNLLGNAGFEDGRGSWYSIRPPDWELSTERAHSGETSALLRMREGTGGADAAKIFYLVSHLGESEAPDQLEPGLREGAPSELPEVISGYYFVENWVKGTQSQYLQFVVILWADDPNGLPPCPDGSTCPNYQIRYLLAGIDEDPFGIANAEFIYLSSDQPVEGEWVYFERNLREDFQRFWGAVPQDLTNIRLLFEVRYDNKEPGEGPLEADVYYDDLYLGPVKTE